MINKKNKSYIQVLFEQKDRIPDIQKKHKKILAKANKASVYLGNFYTTTHFFGFISTLFFLNYSFQSLSYFYLSMLAILISPIVFLYPITRDKINGFDKFKKICLSPFFKHNKNDVIERSVHEKNGIVSQKSLNIIQTFYKELSKNDFRTYQKLIQNQYIDMPLTDIITYEIHYYLTKNTSEDIKENKEVIFKLIDLLDSKKQETFALISLYIDKTAEKGIYNNEALNRIQTTEKKIEPFIIKNKKLLIKEI
jgi:hypothetical protein